MINDGDCLIGSWNSQIPWNVDLYHKNDRGQQMYSKIKDGERVHTELTNRYQVSDNA